MEAVSTHKRWFRRLLIVAAIWASPFERAEAETPSDFAAAMGITAADGSVRTRAGVRLSLNADERMAEGLSALRGSLQSRMGDVRRCFAEAMVRSADVHGTVTVALHARAGGASKSSLVNSDANDATMVSCMVSALSNVSMRGLRAGAVAEAVLEIDNPVARIRQMQAERPAMADVRMLAGGMAEGTSETEGREVGFRLLGSAYASGTIAALQEQYATHLPGLLDCRRKATRKGKAPEGAVTVPVSVRDGTLVAAHASKESVRDRRLQACVTEWVKRADVSALSRADLELSVHFTK